MGIFFRKTVAALGDEIILSPERFDPRRNGTVSVRQRMADFFDVVTENVTVGSLSMTSEVLVLDTTHAYEGCVVFRHDTCKSSEIGSSKRILRPGDVIVSRLRPYLRQVAYIDPKLFLLAPNGNSVVASTEFFVLRSRKSIPASAMVPLLLSKQVQDILAAGQEGGHHPRFSKELLLSVPIPDALVRDALIMAKDVEDIAASVRGSFAKGKKLFEVVDAIFAEMLNHPAKIQV